MASYETCNMQRIHQGLFFDIFAMYPIIGRLPNILVYSYTVVWGATLLLTAALTYWQSQHRPNTKYWYDGFLWAIGGALLGGRGAFIWLNHSYFAENPARIWQIFSGGFFYHGALAGGLLLFWLWCLFAKRPFYPYATLLTPAVLWAHSAGWLACLLEGCAYGRPTFLTWYTADLPDSYGVYAVRYPTQLAGILLSLLAAVAILRLCPADGRRFWLALAVLNAIYGAITLWRGDSLPVWAEVRLDTLLAAGFALGAFGGIFLTTRAVHKA